jgi:protease-4
MRTDILAALRRVATSYVLVVVLGLVVGLTLAPVVWGPGQRTDGTVAVVPVEGTIDGATAANYAAAMERARSSGDIEAVVLVSNSGGGSASASESMYLETKRTADAMPVVASVDSMAASGAYYTVVPSDRIYTKPSSIVGSVGVRANLPQETEPNDEIAATGPNKLGGSDRREFFALIETMRRAFLNAVFEQRGDRLSLSRADVSQAQIYSGSQAVRNGLADGIGDRQAAIREAARLADLEDYRVRVLRNSDATIRFVSRGNYLASAAPNKTMVGPEYLVDNRSHAPVVLMVPGSFVSPTAAVERPDPATTSTPSPVEGDVATGTPPPAGADPATETSVANATRPAARTTTEVADAGA